MRFSASAWVLLPQLVEKLDRAAQDQGGRTWVVARQRTVGEQVLVTWVGEQFGKAGADDRDQFAGGLEVALVREVRVLFHAMDLHPDPVRPWPEGPVLGERDTRLVKKRTACARRSLREALRGGAAEGEAAVDQARRQAGDSRDGAPFQFLVADLLHEGDAVFDGGRVFAIEQVWGVDRVPALAEFLGERAHSVGQPLHVMEQHDLGHRSFSLLRW